MNRKIKGLCAVILILTMILPTLYVMGVCAESVNSEAYPEVSEGGEYRTGDLSVESEPDTETPVISSVEDYYKYAGETYDATLFL